MDEKVLKLFADVGPHAKEALDSYVNLQWAQFIAGYGLGFLLVIGFIFFLYILNKPTPKDVTDDKAKLKALEDELDALNKR